MKKLHGVLSQSHYAQKLRGLQILRWDAVRSNKHKRRKEMKANGIYPGNYVCSCPC